MTNKNNIIIVIVLNSEYLQILIEKKVFVCLHYQFNRFYCNGEVSWAELQFDFIVHTRFKWAYSFVFDENIYIRRE